MKHLYIRTFILLFACVCGIVGMRAEVLDLTKLMPKVKKGQSYPLTTVEQDGVLLTFGKGEGRVVPVNWGYARLYNNNTLTIAAQKNMRKVTLHFLKSGKEVLPKAGEMEVSSGKLTADNVWEKRRQIGMVFQNPDNQFVGATVEDDVAFGLENQGIDYPMMVKRVHEALELVGMQNFKEREPARLSGGQKQRVAIAGVVALQPDIIILDEATSMLDPEGRLELIRTVKKIKDKNHLTVISITHDLDEISLSDRVLVMKNGQVESTATPRELFSRPDLEDLGLDQPFVNQVKAAMIQTGLTLPETYLTEKELQEQLWELL